MKHANPQRLKGDTFETNVFNKDGTVNQGCPFIHQSCYNKQLKLWLQYFDKDQFLIVDGDRFKEDQVSVLNEVESFLGVEHEISKDKFVYNEERGLSCVKTPTGEQACLSEGKGRAHPALNDNDYTKLKKYFQPHNEEFFKLFGKRYTWWYNFLLNHAFDTDYKYLFIWVFLFPIWNAFEIKFIIYIW